MRFRQFCVSYGLVGLVCAVALGFSANGWAQSDSPWVVDIGIGIAPSINGNVNSGAIGTLQGQATAMLPQSYGDVYGTGLDFRFGGGYTLNENSELRGVFSWQTADADLVRLGDIGPSSLYVQYSDYKSLGLDFGYRRYLPMNKPGVRVYGEASIGAAFIDRINAQFAAPQSAVILNSSDFYDQTAAMTLGVAIGGLFKVANQVDINVQMGLRKVTGLAEVDQLVGTGLEGINNDTARLTFPIVVGVRYRFP